VGGEGELEEEGEGAGTLRGRIISDQRLLRGGAVLSDLASPPSGDSDNEGEDPAYLAMVGRCRLTSG